jgi:chitinase
MQSRTSVTASLLLCLALAACGTETDAPGHAGGADAGPGAGDPEDDPKTPDPDATPGERRIVAYFTAWAVYGRDYHVADIPAEQITHINYAFANISEAGECVLGDPYADIDRFYEGDSWDAGSLRGNFNQLIELRQAHPHLRTLISVGGWTWSGRFSDVALTAGSRERFAASCVDFMKRYGFDGIDIDWEYPVGGGLASNTTRPEDKQNYTLLMKELRQHLDVLEAADNRDYLLTIAAPAGPGTYANLEIAELGAVLDWINLMTYDFHGAWSPITNFNAPLYRSSTDPTADPDIRDAFNVDAAVTAYLDAGVPSHKLVIGVPFYGRGWRAVGSGGDGLYQAHGGAAQGTWEAGVFDYGDLVENYLPTHQRFVHPEAKVPWLFEPSTGVMISYDDPESLTIKAEYVVERQLGGVMFWELSGDDDASSLLGALHDALN